MERYNRLMRFLLLLSVALYLSAQPADPWKPLQFLGGEWIGEGAGSPGESTGACSFAFDLQRKVLIRKSYAESPRSRHDDLMVVFLESKNLKAIYFDSEDHVIRYTVEAGPDLVRFINEQYRLTYRKSGEDKLLMDFDVGAPGKPLSNYLHATLRRK
jgi:hypothetical protein